MRRHWSRRTVSVAAGMAGALGFSATALLVDARADNAAVAAPERAGVLDTVLAPVSDTTQLSPAGVGYSAAVWATDTASQVRGAWGAVMTELGPAGPVATIAEASAEGLVADRRLLDPATPGFTDPCAGSRLGDRDAGGESGDAGDGDEACADDDAIAGTILGDGSARPNWVRLHPFPAGSIPGAGACPFDDWSEGRIPVVAVTANPGRVTVTVGDQEATAEPSAEERDEWDGWIRRPLGVRPPVSLVSHCIVVDVPTGPGPHVLRAEARDDDGSTAVAEVAVTSLAEGLPPVAVTPVDGTMVRVDVPLAAGSEEAVVNGAPLSAVGAADCNRLTPEMAAAVNVGWRRGSRATIAAGGDPPWLGGADRLQRVTVPLAEGEPNLVCVDVGSGPDLRRATVVVTPPDARRLTLVVSEVTLREAAPDGTLAVTGTFVPVGWTPCLAAVPAAAGGTSAPGAAGVLCTSGGDAGAVAGAGGVLTLTVAVDGSTAHTARIPLLATPGGPAVASYRLPVPRPRLSGVLCTLGADEPGCETPDATATIGSLVVTALWDEGAIGSGGHWVLAGPAG